MPMSDLATGFCDGLKSLYQGDPLDWLEAHVRLPHSDRSKAFDRQTAPWLKHVIASVLSDQYHEVVLAAPTGGAKTTLLELLLPYIIAVDPGPTLVVGQTDDLSKEWAESRLLPVLNDCKPVAALFPKDRHAKRKTEIMFPHMPLFLAGANMSSLQEKSMRYCIGDEVWRWREGMIGELRKRHHDRWNRKTLLVSQGSDETHDFHKAWLRGTQEVIGFTCPKCGEWSPWSWSHVTIPKASNGEWAKPNDILTGTYYECPRCKHRFEDNAKTRRELSLASEYKATNPNAVKGVCSIRYSILPVWWTSWGEVACEWVEAQERARENDFAALKQFINKRLAEPWTEREMEPAAELIGSDYTKQDYADGQKWEKELYRFLTADKQRDHFWIVVRAWAQDGSSRLIYEGRVNTFEQIANIGQRLKVQPRLILVDAQFDSGEVYRWCAANDWTALHGSGDDRFYHNIGGQQEARYYSTKKRANLGRRVFARYYLWASDPVKDKLAALRRGAGESWEIPKDVSQDYIEQIDSEVKKDFIHPKTKQVTQRWQRVRRHNHLWDCEAMQVAAAMILQLFSGKPQ
jgi:phage terminase large subunit GpA-like protein